MDKMFDLSKMTVTALEEAANILNTYANTGVPSDFYDEGVTLEYNEYSGMVFLTNEDYQVAVYNDTTEELESWYTLPWGGEEGTLSDLIDAFKEGYIEEEDDLLYLKDLCVSENEFDIASEISDKLNGNEEEAE